MTYAFLIAVAIILVLLLLLYFFYKKNKSLKKEISDQKQHISNLTKNINSLASHELESDEIKRHTQEVNADVQKKSGSDLDSAFDAVIADNNSVQDSAGK